MAFLINRNPPARFECLHALLKFLLANYGTSYGFSLTETKFNPQTDNVHKYCSLLTCSSIGIKYCPYKQNPLDAAGCALTNGVDEDTTKTKEVGNTVNALHGLGFVKRDNNKIWIQESGVAFANAIYGSEEMQKIISKAIINYGPIVGLLNQINNIKDSNDIFDSRDIVVGYPNTSEIVNYEDYNIELSTGSKKDSNTRTRSSLLAWLTTGGYIRPKELKPLGANEFPHYEYRNFLNLPHRGETKYKVIKSFNFADGFETERPLDYKNLTKLTAALREHNQDVIRKATLHYEKIIKNRRFAIIYLLNRAYQNNTYLSLDKLIDFMFENKSSLLTTEADITELLYSEMEICNMAGIPFDVINSFGKIKFKPLCGINIEELSSTANEEVVSLLINAII